MDAKVKIVNRCNYENNVKKLIEEKANELDNIINECCIKINKRIAKITEINAKHIFDHEPIEDVFEVWLRHSETSESKYIRNTIIMELRNRINEAGFNLLNTIEKEDLTILKIFIDVTNMHLQDYI